jgi:hypothetical protein
MQNKIAFAALIMECLKDEQGMPWKAFRNLKEILEENSFPNAAAFLIKVDATDDRFYVDGDTKEEMRKAFLADLLLENESRGY